MINTLAFLSMELIIGMKMFYCTRRMSEQGKKSFTIVKTDYMNVNIRGNFTKILINKPPKNRLPDRRVENLDVE